MSFRKKYFGTIFCNGHFYIAVYKKVIAWYTQIRTQVTVEFEEDG